MPADGTDAPLRRGSMKDPSRREMKLRFSTRCLLILLFVLLSAAGCDTTPADKPSVAPASKPEVRIGRVICGGHLPLAVVEKRYGEELEGFKLTAVQYHDWKVVVQDMLSGRLAGTFILSPLAMDLIRNGFPGKIILMADRNGNGLIVSDEVGSIDGLKGRDSVIAVPHMYSQHNLLLHLALKTHGVDPGRVSVVGMPPRDMINALKRGEIDGFVVGEPESNKSISLGVGRMAAISPEVWPGHMDHVFLATERFMEETPEVARELVSSLVRAGRFIEANPREAAVMGEDYTGSSAAVFEQVLTTPPDWIDYSDMRPTQADFGEFSSLMVEMGLWGDSPEDGSIFFDPRFLDDNTKTAKRAP